VTDRPAAADDWTAEDRALDDVAEQPSGEPGGATASGDDDDVVEAEIVDDEGDRR